MPCWTFRNSSRQKSLSQKVFPRVNLGMTKITREHWQQVSFIVSSSVLHGDYTGVMSTVCYAGSTCGVNAEAPHAAGGLPRRLEDGVRLWNAARGARRSKWGDDSETSVSCPRKRASRLGRTCRGSGFPLSRER